MKRKTGKRLLASALAMGLFASLSVTAMADAGTTKVEGFGEVTNQNGVVIGNGTERNGELSENNGEVKITVKAQTSGGDEIKYDVDIAWGAMQFEYDYGSTWDTTTHSYTIGSSGKQQGGWVPSYLVQEGTGVTNNMIRVTNNSNFPMQAAFSYEAATGAWDAIRGSVTGRFSTDANIFVTGAGASARTTEAVDNGTAGSADGILHMEMDASSLASGDFYYYKSNSAAAEGGTAYTQDIFFTLAGKPSKGGPTTLEDIGTITVTITPEQSVTRATKS